MNPPTFSLADVAARLDLDPEQMLAWNMVVVLGDHGRAEVPAWCAEPCIARVLPILAEVFRGEALDYCLTEVRCFGDGRSGVEALRDGDWRLVLDRLKSWRRQFDHQMRPQGGDPGRLAMAARSLC